MLYMEAAWKMGVAKEIKIEHKQKDRQNKSLSSKTEAKL